MEYSIHCTYMLDGYRYIVYITRPVHQMLARFWHTYICSFDSSFTHAFCRNLSQALAFHIKKSNMSETAPFCYDANLNYFGLRYAVWGVAPIVCLLVFVVSLCYWQEWLFYFDQEDSPQCHWIPYLGFHVFLIAGVAFSSSNPLKFYYVVYVPFLAFCLCLTYQLLKYSCGKIKHGKHEETVAGNAGLASTSSSELVSLSERLLPVTSSDVTLIDYAADDLYADWVLKL